MSTVQLDDGIFRTDGPDGLVVVTERLDGVRSAAVGLWYRIASGHETRPGMGVSHLLEHMVFKGTERRSAREIALALESRGGSLDAFTSRDHTAFQAHVLDADLPTAMDVLTDLTRRPLLREEDLALERNVVLEELRGVHDTPDDLVMERWNETLWPDHPYGFSILGTAESLAALDCADLRALHRRGYLPANAVLTVAGHVEHDQVLELLHSQGWLDGDPGQPVPAVAPAPAIRGAHRVERYDSEQVHAVIGTDTVNASDDRRWGLGVLSTALGGGMSSRLFQSVRETLGLCYAIQAWHVTYRAAGVFGIYVGTQPATADRALEAIRAELARVAREGLPEVEVTDARNQLKGQVMLALESTVSRMNRLAAHLLNQEPYRSIDEILRRIDAVTVEECATLAATFLPPERMSTVLLGPSR